MIENIKKYTEANIEAWNEAMPKHQAAAKEKTDKCFSQLGYIAHKEGELLSVLNRIDISGKDVIHLCCNNGTELLSLKNMGAGRCVGIDISAVHSRQEELNAGTPLSFILIRRKK